MDAPAPLSARARRCPWLRSGRSLLVSRTPEGARKACAARSGFRTRDSGFGIRDPGFGIRRAERAIPGDKRGEPRAENRRECRISNTECRNPLPDARPGAPVRCLRPPRPAARLRIRVVPAGQPWPAENPVWSVRRRYGCAPGGARPRACARSAASAPRNPRGRSGRSPAGLRAARPLRADPKAAPGPRSPARGTARGPPPPRRPQGRARSPQPRPDFAPNSRKIFYY